MYHVPNGETPRQATVNDNRVTPVGRFLRRTRIDELPQLINVIKGDMSLVGTRPECIEYMQGLTEQLPAYTQRLCLKPGLIGIAQIEGGYANSKESYQRKLELDLIYLRHCCIRNDLKILLRTAKSVNGIWRRLSELLPDVVFREEWLLFYTPFETLPREYSPPIKPLRSSPHSTSAVEMPSKCSMALHASQMETRDGIDV